MAEKQSGNSGLNLLFFCPSQEKSNSEHILGILHSGSIPHLHIETVDENSPSSFLVDKNYDAVIIVYTSAVECSPVLFAVVHYIDQRKPSGRFIFLPKTGGKEEIPPIFHSIRALQLRLYYFSIPETLEAHLEEFRQDLGKFAYPPEAVQVGGKSKDTKPRQAGFALIVVVSILILFLVGLTTVIAPMARDILFNPGPTPIQPPAATTFWLQESFQGIDISMRWQEQHYHNGRQALQVSYPDTGLRLTASAPVTDAVYQLESRQGWPLDELQSLSFSFGLSAMDDPDAQIALVFGLFLSEDNSYRLDCLIIPGKTNGQIQCQIRNPDQTTALTEAIPLTLISNHTAILVFNPLDYSFQFFLDGQYYGRQEIQQVEFWRSRTFQPQIRTEIQNLNNGSFSCEFQQLNLAHQP